MNPWVFKVKLKRLAQKLTEEFHGQLWDDACAAKMQIRTKKLLESLNINGAVELEIQFVQRQDNRIGSVYLVDKVLVCTRSRT